jgi:predicted nuclease of restriction endonuclease-like (RecB) superfamily
LGKDISFLIQDAHYGNRFYQSVSADLEETFPDVHSFSVTNLKYMRYFYEMYPDAGNRQQAVDDLVDIQNRQQSVDELGNEVIFYIPWGHHILLLSKCKGEPEKALFYVRKTLENNWSRAVLMNFLGTDLYERQGRAVTNFALTLPKLQSDLAQEITRDPYNFDFLTIREQYDEKELKDALLNNIEKFLLELGNGFAFVGREVQIDMGETENFMDLLFYNIKLHCYVVVEVKIREFKSSDMGQLGTYMVAVNHQMKGDSDGPTLGLLICRSKDNVKARYALEASNQPMGISEYDIGSFMPEKYKSSLPTIEEIETELSDTDSIDEGEQG